MTNADLRNLIDRMGFPNVYHHWEEDKVPQLPYLVFDVATRNDFHADNCNYLKINVVTLSFYDRRKNFAAEEKIESCLEMEEIPYSKQEQYLESELLLETDYTFEVVGEEMPNEH